MEGSKPEDIFGWNPFSQNKEQPLGGWAKSNKEIDVLSGLYQKHLAGLTVTHGRLKEDQNSLNGLLRPFKNSDGDLIKPPTERLVLMKQGLDLRLEEFGEDCRRLRRVERRLQRSIEGSAVEYEAAMFDAKGFADERLLEKIREQQRTIELQARDLEEVKLRERLQKQQSKRMRRFLGSLDSRAEIDTRRQVPYSPRVDVNHMRGGVRAEDAYFGERNIWRGTRHAVGPRHGATVKCEDVEPKCRGLDRSVSTKGETFKGDGRAQSEMFQQQETLSVKRRKVPRLQVTEAMRKDSPKGRQTVSASDSESDSKGDWGELASEALRRETERDSLRRSMLESVNRRLSTSSDNACQEPMRYSGPSAELPSTSSDNACQEPMRYSGPSAESLQVRSESPGALSRSESIKSYRTGSANKAMDSLRESLRHLSRSSEAVRYFSRGTAATDSSSAAVSSSYESSKSVVIKPMGTKTLVSPRPSLSPMPSIKSESSYESSSDIVLRPMGTKTLNSPRPK